MRSLLRGIALCAAVAGATMACHEVGDVKVLSLDFDGTSAFTDAALKRVLATRASGWLPWSTKRYFDRAEFESDLKRIAAFYADRGFPQARVTDVNVTFNENKDGVRLRITIDEGTPVIVDEVRFEGFEVLPADAQARLTSLPLVAGNRRDRALVRETRDEAAQLFRERGYPLILIDAGERPGRNASSVIVTYRADPGPEMTFGTVTVHGVEQLEEQLIRREVAFSPGEQFDERLVSRTQRRLGSLELLDLAVVTPDVEQTQENAVPVRITVSEGKPRLLMLGIGYGSEELVRGTVSWQHLNFLGGAKRATVDGKWSAIDRGVHLGLTDPHVKRPGVSSRFSLSAWRTEQLTYESEVYGARAGLMYETESGPAQRPVFYSTRATYAIELLRYGIRPEFLEDQSRRDERIALGLDPDTGRAVGRLATLRLDLERHALDSVANPRRGTMVAGHLEFASPALGGSFKYVEVGGEIRGFMPIGPVVLAGRMRAATILAGDPAINVPFSKRYFLGGSDSLRGWNRFEVSPLDDRGRPVGGYTAFNVSAELRIPVPGASKFNLVAFTDGGNVWGEGAGLGRLLWTAGVGVRYLTPVGPLRLDVGRQLTPIEGLFINGQHSTRRWRLHFSLGHSF